MKARHHRAAKVQALISNSSRLLATALLLASLTTQAQIVDSGAELDTAPSATAMALDLAIARPLGLAMTVAGTAIFILQLPLDLLQWKAPADPARKLIVEPARFTFSRPLGDFD